MRNTREILDVVCPIIEEQANIETDKSTKVPPTFVDKCFNVFLATQAGIGLQSKAQLSRVAISVVDQHHDTISSATKAVLRCFHPRVNFFTGSAYLLAPGIVASNWHVINGMDGPLFFSNSNTPLQSRMYINY
jgi:hypothetical protein